MFYDDIVLVHEMVKQYGLLLPFVDLGGLNCKDLTIADYQRTIKTGDQQARYLRFRENVFEDIAPGYQIINPQYDQPPIEKLVDIYPDHFGTIACLSVLEHVKNPFEIFDSFHRILKPGGLLILSTVFSFPEHDVDYWRFTPGCLNMLADQAGLEIIESGYRLWIDGGMGVKEIHTGVPQEIKSVYIVARKA